MCIKNKDVHLFGILKKCLIIISCVGCSQGIGNLKISAAITFSPSVKVSWRECEFYDRRQRLQIWPQHLVVILMYTDGFEPPVTESWQSLSLINKCTPTM